MALRTVSRLTQWAAVALVCAEIIFLRSENIRGIALPLWVDSVHHSAIARLILKQGGLPSSYRPFADVDSVYYHLGYHVSVALLAALSRQSVEQVMLVFGQVLNVLTCMTLSLLAACWTGRTLGGLAALVVSGTLSLMPAYYVTWGRYTQLMGLALLPIAMLLITDALVNGRRLSIVVGGIMAGALFYVHYRVAFFLSTYVLVCLLWHSISFARASDRHRRLWTRFGVVTTIALICALPWLWRLASTFILPLDTFFQRISGPQEYNAVPWELMGRDLTGWLAITASLGLVLALRACRWQAGVVLLWCVLTLMIVNPGFVGLSPTWIVNNFSLAISAFVPIAVLCAFATSECLSLAETHLGAYWSSGLELTVALFLLVVAIVGGQSLIHTVNPVTILATREDVAAMDWIQQSTPANALFLVNERFWQSDTYVGTDAGYWIPNLTGRRTTMPIVFYTGGSPQYVENINSLARIVEAGPKPDDPAFLTLLRERGVTHVYIGVKGGPLPLDSFLHSPNYTLLYSAGGAYVFALNGAS